jgi:hypothetical protein
MLLNSDVDDDGRMLEFMEGQEMPTMQAIAPPPKG